MLTVEPPTVTPTRQRACSAVTRERILAAALSVFAEEGFSHATVRAIASRAGITDAAIYYHFATKEDLFEELVQTHLTLPGAETKPPGPDGMHTVMCGLANEAFRAIEGNRELLTIIFREALAGHPAALRRHAQLWEGWELQAADRLRRFEVSGELEPGESEQVAKEITYSVIMCFEDMMVLRPDPSLAPSLRLRRAREFVSRCVSALEPAGQGPGPARGSRARPSDA